MLDGKCGEVRVGNQISGGTGGQQEFAENFRMPGSGGRNPYLGESQPLQRISPGIGNG